jgi:hypothetical protein
MARLGLEPWQMPERWRLPHAAAQTCACTAMTKRACASRAQAPLTDFQVERRARAGRSCSRDGSMRRRFSTSRRSRHSPREARRSTPWLRSARGAMGADGSTEWRAALANV